MRKKKDEVDLSSARRSYKLATEVGDKTEEARWSNIIGNILKNRGEYVEALRWYRIDYEVSVKHLPEKQLLATCQSLGEVYLRLHQFQDALIYQKKHLDLANDQEDLVEQQRANTQLGRTYHEMYLKDEDDQISLRNARKYFMAAMKLVSNMKKSKKHPSLKEYVDAHNNIGMVEIDLDNFEEAEDWLIKGLEICDEEEVKENDDGRTRLHHNLGNIYIRLRKWDEARIHIEKDIAICKNIGHCQGEAKGYINLGEWHYMQQNYEDAILCYEKAMNLAKQMDDEHDLVSQICGNKAVVKKATEVMEEIKKEEQNLKKLIRNMKSIRGTSSEMKCLKEQYDSFDRLIEKASIIFAWQKHCEFAKKKKKIAIELCDKVKLGDSYLVISESYQKLRNFVKAKKWAFKSLETYESIANLEGQALAKINLGGAMDSLGKWSDALDTFTEGYRLACQANALPVQLNALENMHYSHMIRFDNHEEARRLQSEIKKLKQLESNKELEQLRESCSETDTDGDDDSPPKSNESKAHENNESASDEDVPLVSLFSKSKGTKRFTSSKPLEVSATSMPTQTVSRKRCRIVLSDDDEDEDNNKQHVDSSASHERKQHVDEHQDAISACSYKGPSPTLSAEDYRSSRSHVSANVSNGVSENICLKNGHSGPIFNACEDEYCKHLIFKVEDDFVHVEPGSCKFGDKLSMEHMKVEVACLYFLKLVNENRSRGVLPFIQHLKCGGEVLESLNSFPKDYMSGKCWIEVSIDRWVPKRLVKLYVDCCKDISQSPNLKLLKKLYNLEVSEDEIEVSDCELEDISAAPLLNALHLHKTIAALNLSHNLLGNETMENLKNLFLSSSQKYGGLVLDLHCNRFGPTALFQICECTVLLSRLEVVNISGNRLTDGCASYLSTILQNCKALYSLNIQNCSITSRTIQKVTDSLTSGSLLSELFIGYNSSISGNAIVHLLDKLATLNSFSQINLNGIKLNKNAIDSLCNLIKTSSLSHLMIGETSIGNERAIQLSDSWNSENCELLKLDLSYCLLTSNYITKFVTNVSIISSLLHLNIRGNPLMQEGGIPLVSLVKNRLCCLKSIDLSKCQLGLDAVLSILRSLEDNTSIEELNLSENALEHEYDTLVKVKAHEEEVNNDMCDLEVAADSEDENEAETPCVHHSFGQKLTFIEHLSSAISMAKQLRVLDISNNGFSGETFNGVWSTKSGGSLTERHIEGSIIHLSAEPNQCCSMKPCCTRF